MRPSADDQRGFPFSLSAFGGLAVPAPNVPFGAVLISGYGEPLGRRYDAAMKTRLALSALLLTAVVGACGASATGAPPSANSTAAATAAASAPAGNGTIDCAKLKAAAVHLLDVQFLAQLTTADTIAAVKAQQIGNLDLDAFLSAMHDLHALDSYNSALGDPKAAIAFYETAGNAAKTLFAVAAPTQADIDTYNTNVGTVTAFLGHQIAIAGAMDAAGC